MTTNDTIEELKNELALYKRRFNWVLEQDWFEREGCFELHVRPTDDNVVYKSLIIEAIDKEMFYDFKKDS